MLLTRNERYGKELSAIRWLMPQGGMKLGYGGLALLAAALLLRLVYAGPPASAR